MCMSTRTEKIDIKIYLTIKFFMSKLGLTKDVTNVAFNMLSI
jgi:hypothetical protein